MSDDCVFCKIASGAIPSTLVWQNDEFVAFPDLHPQAPTHVLVIPKHHVPSLLEANDPALLGKLMIAVKAAAHALGLEKRGFRTVINTGPDAGQVVFHLHVHILGGKRMPD